MQTLTTKQEFQKVYFDGRRFSHCLLRMVILKDDEFVFSKVAFVAPKRLGNAVFRNRCKRVMRAAAYYCCFPQKGLHIIFFATPATYQARSTDIVAVMKMLLKKAGYRGEE